MLNWVKKIAGWQMEPKPAIEKPKQVISDQVQQWMREGFACYQTGNYMVAGEFLERVLNVQPDHADAGNSLGTMLYLQGRLEESIARFQLTLDHSPDFAEVHSNLGAALHDAGHMNESEISCRRALQLKPDYAEAHNNLGNTLRDMGRLNEAEASYRQALQLRPDYAEALVNLGRTLREMGRLKEAEANYRRALQLTSDYADAHSNLGNTLRDMGCLDEAEASCRRALQLRPDSAEAHNNLGYVLLAKGRLFEAWPEYEYRWKANLLTRPIPSQLPQWQGQNPSPNDRLLVYKEQGIGDQLQFSRYLPLTANCFEAGVSIVVANPLLALFRRSFPNVIVMDDIPIDLSAWQWQCPLISLPLAFGTTLETIPGNVPYLVPNPERVSYWKEKISALGLPPCSRKIGVVWKPGSIMKNAPLRALTLQQLSPLLNLPGCTWFSLQKEPDPDKALWVASGKLIDWAEEFGNFDETAALVANLDLVISVDTAMVHLAGGLGRPVWLFNRHASEWRWLHARIDSPWYPTMRIFTQNMAGDWVDVVRRMYAELHEEPLQNRIV